MTGGAQANRDAGKGGNYGNSGGGSKGSSGGSSSGKGTSRPNKAVHHFGKGKGGGGYASKRHNEKEAP